MRSRVRGAVVCALAALVLTVGCSTDDPDDEPDGAPSSSSGADSSPATATPESPTATEDSVTPADGRRVEVGPMSYRLVDADWLVGRQGQTAYLSDTDGAWYVSSASGYATDGDLDRLAEVAIDAVAVEPAPERADDRVVAGVLCYVLESRSRTGLFYQVGGIVDGEFAYLQFEFPVDTPQADEWVEQMLASVEWR